jgi:hypothetical protein
MSVLPHNVVELLDSATLNPYITAGVVQVNSSPVVQSGTLQLTDQLSLLTVGQVVSFGNTIVGGKTLILGELNQNSAAQPLQAPTPEPGTLALLVAAGFAGLVARVWRRRS